MIYMLVITSGKKKAAKNLENCQVSFCTQTILFVDVSLQPHRMTKVSRRRSSLEFNKKYTIVNEQNKRTFIPVPIQKHLKAQARQKMILSFLSIDLIRSKIA